MKKIMVLTAIISIAICTSAFAREYKTPHILKAGDVVSAEVINEAFASIENLNKTILSSDIIGTWNCIESSNTGYDVGFTVTQETSVFWTRSQTISFSSNPDGSYTWTSELYDPFAPDNAGSYTGNYLINNNMIIASTPNLNGESRFSPIRLSSPSRFVTTGLNLPEIHSMLCDKNDIPPVAPTDAVYSVIENVVTITWTDESSDETGFNIIRRDSIDKKFTSVGSSSASSNTYQEILSSGTYWYRIESVNSHGNSIGSNVIKVVIP